MAKRKHCGFNEAPGRDWKAPRQYSEATRPPHSTRDGPKFGINISSNRDGPSSKDGSCLTQYLPPRSFKDACSEVMEIARVVLAHGLGASWSVVAQGSFVQNLQLDGSDLDLVVLDGTDRWRNLNRRKNAEELELAVRQLTRSSALQVRVMRKIYSARVPLARLRVNLNGVEVFVDLCFGDPKRGLCDEFVRRVIAKLGPECERFVLLMKLWATKRALCETHAGGISCFAVVLLALFHFQHSSSRTNLLGLTTSFLRFFQSLEGTKNTVILETMQLGSSPSDFLHVKVPCREGENAARCLTHGVWVRKLLPELRRGISLCERLNAGDAITVDRLAQLLLGDHEEEARPTDRRHYKWRHRH